MEIRATCPADYVQIDNLLKAAFGGPGEAKLVKRLRQDGDIKVSLVATVDAHIVGHIVLSKMTSKTTDETSNPVRILGLAPVSVLPAYQNQGIGSVLIRRSLALAKTSDWQAVFLLGHADYYPRFGFNAKLAQPFTSPYSGSNFMALELQDGILHGRSGAVSFAPAFSAP
ncbi:MAG: GNAT family N-acetyltransferase [Robiginitomaculum sp.]|nr:MAG: GNAT family N-acetyltransferase [Robiginitomaculum sp.]